MYIGGGEGEQRGAEDGAAVLQPDHQQCGHHCRAARPGRRERGAQGDRRKRRREGWREERGRGEGKEEGEAKGTESSGGGCLQPGGYREQRVDRIAARHAAPQNGASISTMQQNAEVLKKLPENDVLGLARGVGLIFGKADEHLGGRSAPGSPDGLSDDGDETQALIDACAAGVKVSTLEILICAHTGGSIC